MTRPQGAVSADLAAALEPFRRRALIDLALRWGLLSVASWCCAMAVLLAWSKLSPTAGVGAAAAVLGTLAAAGGALGWALNRPDLLQVARVADARLDLGERLASAVCLAYSPGEMGTRLRADAVAYAGAHPAAGAFPLWRHRRRVSVSMVAAVVVAALVLTPNPQAGALQRQAAQSELLARARSAVVKAEKELAKPSSTQAKALQALRQALSRLRQAHTPVAALVALSQLDNRLQSLDNSTFEADQEADAAAGAALAGSPGARKLSDDLVAGDLNAAATDLRAVAAGLPELSPSQRRALAAGLEKAARAAGDRVAGTGHPGSLNPGSLNPGSLNPGSLKSAANADAPFAAALARAGANLAAGHTGAGARALRAAADGAAASASASSVQQELQAVQAALRNAQAQVAGQAQAEVPGQEQAGTGDSGQVSARGQGIGAGARSRGGRGSSSGSGTASGSARASSSGNGTGSGGGTNSGAGRGDRAGAGSGQGGPGRSGPGSDAYAQGRNARSGQVFIGGQPGRAGQVVGQQLGNGERVATTGYRAVLPAFEKTALEGLGAQVLSPQDQSVVRAYFSSLGSGK